MKTYRYRAIAPAALMIAASQALNGEVRLPAIFSDNMVVQQNATLTVTGKASP